MRRFLVLSLTTMLVEQVWAATFEINNLKYTVTDETKHYVSVGKGSTSPTGVLEIPSTVKKINNCAFAGSGLEEVEILSDEIEYGGDGVFKRTPYGEKNKNL